MMPAAQLSSASPDAVRFFRLLGDETRLVIVRLLAISDLRAGEIGHALHASSNAVAYHLKQMRTLGVLHERRSTADGRDVYYHLDHERLQQLYAAAGESMVPGLSTAEEPEAYLNGAPPSTRPLRVLFLCTHNSARSQMAEALMRHMGGDQVEVYSAGSMPTEVHPDAITVLRELGIDTSALYAKSLDAFVAEPFDYIITVCDRVRDICPAFTGDPHQIHWSFPDPVVIEDPERRLKAFRQVASELQTRIRYLLILPHPATGERLRPQSL